MKTKTGRRRLAQTALAVAATIGIVATGTPALAVTVETCTLADVWARSCSTRSVRPNSGTHSINWMVSTVFCGATWQVIDSANGVQVGSGYVPADVPSTGWTISGLYSSSGYYLRVNDSCWPTYGKISNP